jgi:hypothetical protein
MYLKLVVLTFIIAPLTLQKIEVDCLSKDDGTPCTELTAPESGKGKKCIVEVEYIYTITNNGPDVERIYSVVVTRGDETIVVTDIPDEIPTVDLVPGEVFVAPVTREIDICTPVGTGAFATATTLLTGPPTEVDVRDIGSIFQNKV